MILCICHRGNVRSATAAAVLKDLFNQSAFAIGTHTFSAEDIDDLAAFADTIYVVGEASMLLELPERVRNRATLIDIGPDIWMFPMHPDLVSKLANIFIDKRHYPINYPSAEAYLAAHNAATRNTIGEWLKS